MTRTITGAAVALTLCALAIIPTFSSALSANEIQDQINELLRRLAELQGQISQNATPSTSSAPSSSGSAQCVKLTRNLSVGQNDAQTGGEVSRLQTYLTQTGDYTYGSVTGYFGPATEVAVQKWQCREMQLCSGSPDTNGYGFVGPRTRAVMAAKCTGTTPPAPTPPVYCPTDVKSCPNGGYVTRTGPSCSFPACPSSNNDLTTGASCTLDGVTISHGSSRIFFKPSIFSNSSNDSCPSQIRACKDGTLQGDVAYSRASCTNTGFMPASCTFNGATVSDGASVTAYQSPSVSDSATCVSQTRTCSNGTLSGSYTYASCSANPPITAGSCTFNGAAVVHGASVTAYQAASIPAGSVCVSQNRTCMHGTLSGSYAHPSCVISGGGYSGSYSATPLSGSAPLTVQFSGTMKFPISAGVPFKMRVVFGDGAVSPGMSCTVSGDYYSCPVSVSHTYTQAGSYSAKIDIENAYHPTSYWTGTIVVAGTQTPATQSFSATPLSGVAPLSVAFSGSVPMALLVPGATDPGFAANTNASNFYTTRVVYGDGTMSPEEGCTGTLLSGSCGVAVSHVYTKPGSYQARVEITRYRDGRQNPVPSVTTIMMNKTIVVGTGDQGGISNSLQFASALAALEEALKGILDLIR